MELFSNFINLDHVIDIVEFKSKNNVLWPVLKVLVKN